MWDGLDGALAGHLCDHAEVLVCAGTGDERVGGRGRERDARVWVEPGRVGVVVLVLVPVLVLVRALDDGDGALEPAEGVVDPGVSPVGGGDDAGGAVLGEDVVHGLVPPWACERVCDLVFLLWGEEDEPPAVDHGVSDNRMKLKEKGGRTGRSRVSSRGLHRWWRRRGRWGWR